METLLLRIALAFLGLTVSARTRVALPVLGPTPVLGIVALAVVLALAVALAALLRSVVRDWPRPVTA
jgi:hypothetical protein